VQADIQKVTYSQRCEKLTPDQKTKMLLLLDMGFSDFEKNYNALAKGAWQVEAAIFEL
jgi:hypothetical protein